MAMTHDYLDQLDQNVGIAPANSQEEYQAAQTIADIMRRHGVEPSIEEFDAKAFGGVMDQILFAMLFVGMLLVGIGAVPLTVIGFVLVALPVAAFVARYLGNDFVEKLGPSARSQNVVAFHKGEGPLVQKGVRPIVIVAHYDTPHENPVYSTPLAPYLPMAWRFSKWCVLAVAVATLFQIMAFLPEAFRRILWVLGLIAALPLLLLAVTGIVELFTPSTEGANDNKTGVAAMLGILQNVRPSDERSAYPANEDPADWVPAEPAFDAVSSYDDASAVDGAAGETPADFAAAAQGASDAGATVAAAPFVPAEPQWRPVPVEGMRHGADVLRVLGMLPEDCQIEYRENVMEQVPAEEVAAAAAEQAAAAAAAAGAGQTASFSPVEGGQDAADAAGVTAAAAPVAAEASQAPAETVLEATAEVPVVTGEDLTATGRFNLVTDSPAAVQSGDGDAAGLTAMGDADATQPTAPAQRQRPAAPEDPEWGHTSFRPQAPNPARRASLFDLPNPGEESMDPFATDPRGQVVTQAPAQPSTVRRPSAVPAPAPVPQQPAAPAQPFGTISAGSFDAAEGEPAQGKHRFGGFKLPKINLPFGHKGAAEADDQREDWLGITDDENWSDEDGGWKGGATTRAGLRLVEDEAAPAGEAAVAGTPDAAPEVVSAADAPAGENPTGSDAGPTDEDLRDAVLAMNDDALLCHDIWFVGLGASGLGHAGMKAFLAQHRKQIRGAFVINIDAVGAGELTMFTREGIINSRRADRRMVRSLARTAADLHIGLAQADHEWGSTDATPSMRAHVRSITISGVDPSGMKALSGTPADVIERVNPAQAAQVAALVTEMIRRS